MKKRDLKADREVGEYWERQFCLMAAEFNFMFTPIQIGRGKSAVAAKKSKRGKYNVYTLPDIILWTAPGQHHEIKHKNPTKWGAYGLEVYRLNALVYFAQETRQGVYYTIHNYDLNGGKDSKENDITHWVTADVLHLDRYKPSKPDTRFPSYVNGILKQNVPMWFWDTSFFTPLLDCWIKETQTNDSIL